MNKQRTFLIPMLIALGILMGIFLLTYSPASGQDEPPLEPVPTDVDPTPPAITMFHIGCQQSLGDLHLRIHFGYASDGVETFNTHLVSFNENSIDTAFINVPETWDTEAGYHDDFYLDMKTEDTPYTYYVVMTGVNQIDTLPLNTWDVQDCPDGMYEYTPETPEPTADIPALHPTPDPTECPAWSYDSATGNTICLWELPYAPVN